MRAPLQSFTHAPTQAIREWVGTKSHSFFSKCLST
uniref:Uncharacterized protein n=1 Tax=Rhizophora mucronata TaxID=61149 RepID=A0A2P2QTP9_RHIMU